MKVEWKDARDEGRLIELVATTSNAKQRDRYRVVLIAGRGLGERSEVEREQIAATVDRAGWHTAAGLRVPANVTLVLLPQEPGAEPGREPVALPAQPLLVQRLYETWEDLKQAAVAAWRAVCPVPELIKSVCADTALRANQ